MLQSMNTNSFFITSLIIILLPGTGVIYTISIGISKGKKASIFAAFGCTTGIIPHLCASILLSSLLVKMSDGAFWIMKLMGAIYLLYLGLDLLLSKNRGFGNTQTADIPINIIRRGILINLLNPKLTLFFFSFLPQYVSLKSKNYVIECILYGLAFMILTFVVFIGYGMMAGTAKIIVNSFKIRSLIQKLFGLIFIVFAIQLWLSSRR